MNGFGAHMFARHRAESQLFTDNVRDPSGMPDQPYAGSIPMVQPRPGASASS